MHMTTQMFSFVHHALQNNREEIVDKSLLNCHAENLHSIMLYDAPGYTIRLFVAEPDNNLATNFPTPGDRPVDYGPPSKYQTVAFHPHYCNLTISVIKGKLFNWIVQESNDESGFEIEKYIYQSQITTGKMSFSSVGKSRLKTVSTKTLFENESVYMLASEIHTVACLGNQLTAWFIFEGKEDANYQPYSYSMLHPDQQNFDNLYKKASETDVLRILKLVELI